MTWDNFFATYCQPIIEIMILLFFLFLIGMLLYYSLSKVLSLFKIQTREKLLAEIEELKKENIRLTEELGKCTDKSAQGIAVFGAFRVKYDTISYIVSQTLEQPENGNSRIKVIHYINSEKTDSVYATFEYIIQTLPDYFMLVNKNQVINLKEVYNVHGDELYLRNIKSSFIISDKQREDFEERWAQLQMS